MNSSDIDSSFFSISLERKMDRIFGNEIRSGLNEFKCHREWNIMNLQIVFSRPKAGFQWVSPQLDFHHVTDNSSSNHSENHSAPVQSAADLEVPGMFWAQKPLGMMFLITLKPGTARDFEVLVPKSCQM